MTGGWAKVALLWLLASQVIFLVDVRGPATAAWASPFGALKGAAARIPEALRVHDSAGRGIALPGAGMLAVGLSCFAGAGALGVAAFRMLGWRKGGALAVLLGPPAGVLPLAALAAGAGFLGLVRPPTAWFGIASLAALGLARAPALARAARGAFAGMGAAGLLALGAAAFVAGVPAMAPERSADALIYHLPVPCTWLEAGRIVARPDWAFAHLSQAQELVVYAALAAWFDERWAKLASLLYAGWLAVLVSWRGRGTRFGAWAAVLVVTAPLTSEMAGCGKNDALFACAAFAGFLALESGLAAGGTSPIGAAGWLAGTAYAVKNFGVFAVAASAAAVACSGLRRRRAAWMLLLAPAAGAALPWVVRNWLAIGSPAYPFMLSLWTPVGWTAGKLEMMRVVFNARTFPVGGVAGILASPVHALTHASPFLLALFPLAVALRRTRVENRAALAYTGFWFAAWAVMPTGGVVRFLLPLLPPAVVLACAAADGLAGAARRLAWVLLGGAILVQAAAGLAGPAWESAPLGAALGRESLAGFRARTSPVWTEALAWLEGGRGTAVVIGQGIQYPRPRGVRLLGREIENAPVVWELVRGSRGPGELARKFRQRRISFVVYNVTAASFWAKYAESFPWTPRDVGVWRDFWLARARPLHASSVWSAEEGLEYLWLIETGRRMPPPRQASLFLPGTEAVFSGYRQAFFDGEPAAALESRIAPYRSGLSGILAVPDRDACLDLVAGRTRAAADRVRRVWPLLDPLDLAVARLCGTPKAPAGEPLAGWLEKTWPAARIIHSAPGALMLNLGTPPALPPR